MVPPYFWAAAAVVEAAGFVVAGTLAAGVVTPGVVVAGLVALVVVTAGWVAAGVVTAGVVVVELLQAEITKVHIANSIAKGTNNLFILSSSKFRLTLNCENAKKTAC